ncbi:MAG: uroporphyrinogen-III C-methyltransferase [Bacteroidetes bacterium]|nr:uroporphyrinogen-III C-methyltransferase [Bacteroidota bacterium]
MKLKKGNSRLKSGEKGKVYLVGAGTGDPEVITVKALRLIRQADVIVYDSLLPQELLGEVKPYAELVYCGKRAGNHHLTQVQINQKLVDSASSGKMVVRLKGGDPMLFGRGGEEAIFLSENRIPFEFCPGVSALQVCSSYAKIPLTHRGLSSAFMVLSGDFASIEDLDFNLLAKFKGTLVFFMARSSAGKIADLLVEAGSDRNLPVAFIENGGSLTQRVLTGTLEKINELHPDKDAPVLLIIGKTVLLHDRLIESEAFNYAASVRL